MLLCKEHSECGIINLFLMLWLHEKNKLNFNSAKTDPKAVMDKQHGCAVNAHTFIGDGAGCVLSDKYKTTSFV